MAVRAKFRCHSILLTQASRTKDGLEYDYELHCYVDEHGNKFSQQQAVETWEQPTVYLTAVTPQTAVESKENFQFFTATPSAECKLTISNPYAAEFFELGGTYYLDFEKAPDA